MNKEFKVSWITHLNRFILRGVIRFLFRILSPVKIDGLENVPKHGPYMVVFNHVSTYDPPAVAAFWPVELEVLGAVEVWQRKGQNLIAKLYAPIPVHRGEVDRFALSASLKTLRAGNPLLISPEGGRSQTPGLRQAKTGVVYLAERSGVQIVPVGIIGTTRDYFQKASKGDRPVVEIRIGKAFSLPGDQEKAGLLPREIRQWKADFIMTRIAELLPENYRGYYNGQERANNDAASA